MQSTLKLHRLPPKRLSECSTTNRCSTFTECFTTCDLASTFFGPLLAAFFRLAIAGATTVLAAVGEAAAGEAGEVAAAARFLLLMASWVAAGEHACTGGARGDAVVGWES
jgi:hypothetical protein